MTEEMYRRLNSYLNDIFIELNKKDKIFVDNLVNFSHLNLIINDYVNKNICKVVSKSYQNKLTFNDVYLLAREVIEKINSKYLKEYDELIVSGKLNFDYDNKYSSCCILKAKNGIIAKYIDISRKFNYEDVINLIHEFFHYTQIKDSYMTYNYEFLTEFISIYFEQLATNYLVKEKHIPISELNINLRIIDFLRNNNSFKRYAIILLAYENLGDINKNTINEIDKKIGLKDIYFEEECINFLKKLDEINELSLDEEKINKMVSLVNLNYRYIIGTILAYYALKYSNLENMIELNDKINNEYADKLVEEILEKVNIKINKEMINESLNIIKNSIYNYDEVKENDNSNCRSNRSR